MQTALNLGRVCIAVDDSVRMHLTARLDYQRLGIFGPIQTTTVCLRQTAGEALI
jgi:hypothetical protein